MIKSIHDTTLTVSFHNHAALNVKSSIINNYTAHSNHFKRKYKEPIMKFSILQVVFDYNYFLCNFNSTALKIHSSKHVNE
jgi:hypothetical protein